MAQKHNISDTEYPMTRMGTIQQPSRRYRRLRHPSFTAAVWTANNPLLQRGEFGSEIDTGKLKIGDGVTYWNDLGYVAASQIDFANITGSPDDNVALKNALDAKQDVLTEGTGIDIDSDNIISNTGVRSVATGTTNGTISVNTGGTSAEVAVYGLGSAAYTSSSDYATAAQGALADNAANKDLSNLTSTGANIGNWSSNVSNCLTEIPQDIKLELNSGTLTLKAGSKVYIANGNLGTTDTTTNDITYTQSNDGQYLVIRNTTSSLYIAKIRSCLSGTIANRPNTLQDNAGLYFATDENKIYLTGNGGTNWYSGAAYTLPFAIITVSNGAISSIDQVFNGFGYVGSTVFALPGVKGLIPNGRNADGTLKNTEFTVSSVLTTTDSSGATGGLEYYLTNTSINRANFGTYSYDAESNNIVNSSGVRQNTILIDPSAYRDSGKVSSFNPKKVFHAVDYNDTEFIGHQATPSDRYVDMTLPASGNTLVAPADGYFAVGKNATASGQRLRMWYRGTNGGDLMSASTWSSSAANLEVSLYVAKGSSVAFIYSADGVTDYCRFIYANGAK